MIEVEIKGRLGNHLFQYAFGLSLAKDLKTNFRLDHWSETDLDVFFILPSYEILWYDRYKPFSKYYELILNKLSSRKKIVKVEYLNDFKKEDGLTFSGYFQSYSFFKNHADSVRKEFTFQKNYREYFNKKYGELFRNNEILAVHVRRGDYTSINIPELGSEGLELPFDYYREYIKKIISPSTKVVFVSDEIRQVKKEFGSNPNYFFSEENEIIDLLILTEADKLIISNSSFSWWGAFLNQKANHIIAPKYYLGFKVGKEEPKGIMYEGFDWVDVSLDKDQKND